MKEPVNIVVAAWLCVACSVGLLVAAIYALFNVSAWLGCK